MKQRDNHPKVILCGGDGTIMSIINEICDNDINVDNCIFGAIPLGTGNDLANTLGWGSR